MHACVWMSGGKGVIFPSGHPFRLTDRPPKEGASVGPVLPPPPRALGQLFAPPFLGPRVTCPKPPWKPVPAALPLSFFASRVAHPPSQALTLNLGAGRRDASRALTPAYLTPGARRSLVGGQSLEVATRRCAGDSRAAAGVGGDNHRPRRGPSPCPPPPAAPRSPVLRPKAGPP